MKNLLIFGSNSLIAQNIKGFINSKYKMNIYETSSKKNNNKIYFDINDEESYENLLQCKNIDYIVWCQGFNVNDSISSFNKELYLKSMDVNINFIVLSLNYLLKNNKININSRLCIISSIWQEFVRNNKFSYSVSKSAISGLIKSSSEDLLKKNILINAILPGPVDNKMTRLTLTKEQLDNSSIRLIDINDICNLLDYLCFNNNSTTGQSIKIDLGFTNNRNY
jgi:3-oxoacyl-[acyl-carrier protein] reductase